MKLIEKDVLEPMQLAAADFLWTALLKKAAGQAFHNTPSSWRYPLAALALAQRVRA